MIVVAVAGGVDGGVVVPVVPVPPPVVVGGVVVGGGVVTGPVPGMPPVNGGLLGVVVVPVVVVPVVVAPVVVPLVVPDVDGYAMVTFWPPDVMLPVSPVTVVVTPVPNWEAVACCVVGATTKLLVDEAVSDGRIDAVVVDDVVEVVASICRCSSDSWPRCTLPRCSTPRSVRRRDRPPSRRLRKSDNRWETGLRRRMPNQRRPHQETSRRMACPPCGPRSGGARAPRIADFR